jgi:hypothetical protein
MLHDGRQARLWTVSIAPFARVYWLLAFLCFVPRVVFLSVRSIGSRAKHIYVCSAFAMRALSNITPAWHLRICAIHLLPDDIVHVCLLRYVYHKFLNY